MPTLPTTNLPRMRPRPLQSASFHRPPEVLGHRLGSIPGIGELVSVAKLRKRGGVYLQQAGRWARHRRLAAPYHLSVVGMRCIVVLKYASVPKFAILAA